MTFLLLNNRANN